MQKKALNSVLYFAVIVTGIFLAYKTIYIPKQGELVALITILLLYPIFRYPLTGVYAAFLIAPFVSFLRRLYYLIHARPTIDPLIMLTDILVAVVFAGLIFELREKLKEKGHEAGAFLTVVTIYIIYMVIRTFVFNIQPPSESIAKLKYYAPNVLLFYIGFVYAARLTHAKAIWYLTLVIGVVSCLYGLKQLYIGYSSFEKIWFSSISFTTLFIKGIARPFSFFQAPAAFADYLVIGMVAAIMIGAWGKFKSKVFAACSIPLLFSGVLITSVRSSWIGALAVFFFWFGFLKVKKTANRIVIIVLVAVAFFSYQMVDDVLSSWLGIKSIKSAVTAPAGTGKNYVDLLVTNRTGAITNPFEEHSLLSRMTLWQYVFESSLSFERIFLGRGLGTLNSDSLYVTYLAEFGYPGLIVALFFMIGFVLRGLKTLDRLTDDRVIVLTKGIIVMDMVLGLMCVTGSHIHAFPGDMYFWFFNGMLMNVVTMEKRIVQ